MTAEGAHGHLKRARGHLEGALAIAAPAAGRTGKMVEIVRELNAAKAAVKSCEITAGWRGIGAALAADDDMVR